jgi:transcriptional regulator with XRE-family HTH domain
MDLNKYIVSKIKLAREMSGMPIATLARRAGMTPNALSESLRGNRSLTAAELVERRR